MPTTQPLPPQDTLCALLGVGGPLRLLPQGPAPKPHIVLRRDCANNDASHAQNTAGTIRFSFVAGKRFSVNKGQALLFAIAPPAAGSDEKPLNGGLTTFLLEGDLIDSNSPGGGQASTLPAVESAGAESRASFETRLPPRMRKSRTHKQAYASFVSNETPPAAAATPAQGPSNTPALRVLVDTEIQTDPTSPTLPRQVTPIPPTLPCAPLNPIESPTHLPSPVSADHTRDIIPDALAQFEREEADEDERYDRSRSLSPMDLGSELSTPASSVAPLPIVLQPEGLLLRKSPGPGASTPSAGLSECGATADPATRSPTSPAGAPTASVALPQPPSEDLACAPISKEGSATVNITVKARPPNVGAQATKAALPLAGNAAKLVPAPLLDATPELEDNAPQSSLKRSIQTTADALMPANGISSKPAKQPTPTFRNSARSSLSKTWESDGGWESFHANAAPYIPTPTIGNPLGIRPSASRPMPYKPVPKAPRALLGTDSSSSLLAKKPVVVGAKWSAVRNTGSIASASSSLGSGSASGCSLSSSSSSQNTSASSIDTLPAPSVAKPVPKLDLSDVLRYSSPSLSPLSSAPSPPGGCPESDADLKDAQPQGESTSPFTSGSSAPLDSSSALPVNASMSEVSYSAPTPGVPAEWLIPMVPPTPGIGPLSACVSYPGEAPIPGVHAGPTFNQRDSSLKRAFDDWECATAFQSADEHSKRLKVDASASPRSSPSATPAPVHDTPGAPSATEDGDALYTVPTTPISSVLSYNKLSRAKPYNTGETSSWSAKIVVPIPKVTATMRHPLPPKPVSGGSSYRPSQSQSKSRKSKSRGSGQRRTDWPSTTPSAEKRFFTGTDNSGTHTSVDKIIFNGDGTLVAFICGDRTLRIWENKPPGEAFEVARLGPHDAHVTSACWLDTGRVMTLCEDGRLGTWMRNLIGDWKYSVLLAVPEVPASKGPVCMAFHKDRIAVSMMSVVKVWLLISGQWQPQREIVRSGVTALKFVQDGDALIGGCRDGVLWYCEVPNGTLRVHAFLSPKPIISIDVHPMGTYMLVAQEGGKALLVTMRSNQNKGNIERTYTSEKIQAMSPTGFPAVFATKGQAVLYGMMNGCALVWDRKKGSIVYGLKHPEGDTVETAAIFDGRPGVEGWIITGTRAGRVFWWPVPVAAAPSHSAGGG